MNLPVGNTGLAAAVNNGHSVVTLTNGSAANIPQSINLSSGSASNNTDTNGHGVTPGHPDQEQPPRELNILILGETGVGKSTMINSFINYITYETLQEAEAGEIRTIIPTKFSICDENFEEIEVSTGTDKNEIQSSGQSATQTSRVYSFHEGNVILRLIDTPGIGDTRGVEQDKKNFENILATTSSLKEIHGICILLKPNNSRLNLTFRFCIKELLKYLHRDASKNIIFCFTNARGTLYRPGDTMKPLRTLLTENQRTSNVEVKLNRQTVYCFDNETYRFLAAVKNDPPVSFSDVERENFARSWEMSISETKRLLEHIQTLPPHSVHSTLNLNRARELVLKMVRPLAEISRNIQTNKAIVEGEKKDIKRTRETIENLRKKKITTRTEIEMKELPYPKTVCANRNCVTITGVNGVNTTEYKTVCHGNCYLGGVKMDTIGDPKLLNCEAMGNNGFCKRSNCGHNYREHLNIYYEAVYVVKQVENPAVNEALRKSLTSAEIKQKMIDEKNILISEYEIELNKIQKASAVFAYFLKENAITPYNDAMEQYLDHLIKEEQDNIGAGVGTTTKKTLESLQLQKKLYLQEKHILDQQMQASQGAPPQPVDIDRLVNKLKMLKHSGKNLRDALNYVNYAGERVYDGTVVTYQFPRNQGGTSTRPVKNTWFQRAINFAKNIIQ